MPYVIKNGQYVEVDSEGQPLSTGSNTETTSNKWSREEEIKYSKKMWIIVISVIALPLLLFCANFHVISGTGCPTKMVSKIKFTLNETFVDCHEIFGVPRLVVQMHHPLTYIALKKEGYID